MLKVLLSPIPNFAAAAGIAYGVSRLPFFPAVVSVVCLAVSFIIVSPRVQRAKAVWRALCPSRAKHTAEPGAEAPKSPSVVVAHFVKSSGSRIADMARLGGPAAADGAVICVPHTRAFHLPLSRLAINLLGGVVPYSRTVVLSLLKRKTGGGPAVVAYPEPVTAAAGGNLQLVLASKGVFSAALRTGATMIPCLVLEDGSAHYGRPVPVAAVDSAPAPEVVVKLAADYAAALEAVYAKHNASKTRRLVIKS